MIDCCRYKEDSKPSKRSLTICLRGRRICWRTEERRWRLLKPDPRLEWNRRLQRHYAPDQWARQHLPREPLHHQQCLLNDRWCRLLFVPLDLVLVLPTRQLSVDLVQLRRRPRVLLLAHLPLRQDHPLAPNYHHSNDLLSQHLLRDYKRCLIRSHRLHLALL
jgi:hypothetical protein